MNSTINLITLLSAGLGCLILGFAAGRIRGSRVTRQRLMSELPFWIYDKNS